MENLNELFCSNHSKKHAKKHCNKCNLDLCNECALDLHIGHYQSLQKINNSPNNKYLAYKEMIKEEIQKLLNNSIDDITLKVFKDVQEKTKKNLKEDKNQPSLINVLLKQINEKGGKSKKI